ncbi:MAG: DJ-1/PfpI family protein [Bacteroidales bacterium]|nr:DJ-1/PfpI family protein [Bacteroidales bacterium]
MKKVFIHFADGFEEIEALAPVDILRRAGCEVSMVSVTGIKQVTSSRGVKVIADKLFEEMNYDEADMLVLPGGMPGSRNLDQHDGLKAKLMEAANQGKYIGAICAAPMVLGHLGLLNGKRATCYPGNEPDLTGATCTHKGLEIDGNIITAKGAGVSIQFGLALAEVLVGSEKAGDIKEKIMME